MTEDRWAGLPPMQAQSEILTEMSNAMLGAISGEWDYATYKFTRLGGINGQGSGELRIFDAEGNVRKGTEKNAFRLSKDLRRVMFVPGRGSWFTMTLTLRRDGAADADFDYEAMPEFKSRLFGVSGLAVAKEQADYPRDREHQPQWYARLLGEYLEGQEARSRVVEARDRGWARVGRAGQEANTRLVVLGSGVGLLATGGYSDPSPDHPGRAGFELFMPSVLFVGDVERARAAWPFRALNYLVGYTSDEDVDWPARVAGGPVAVTYVANVANDTPEDWRQDGQVCGLLVGVPFEGVPESFEGPYGPIGLVGAVPARPAEWQHLASAAAGGDTVQAAARWQGAREDLAERLAALDPVVLASPDRPSVV